MASITKWHLLQFNHDWGALKFTACHFLQIKQQHLHRYATPAALCSAGALITLNSD